MERVRCYALNLPGISRPAMACFSRAGQEHPSKGDDVVYRWELRLPAHDDADGDLIDDLQYYDRIPPVAGRYLYPQWGAAGSAHNWGWSYRVRAGHASGRTWPEALRAAVAAVKDTLAPLIDALEKRRAVRLAADDRTDDTDQAYEWLAKELSAASFMGEDNISDGEDIM